MTFNKYLVNIIAILCLLMLMVYLSGCATNTPNAYYQQVVITAGMHAGERGILDGDCDGFEVYRIKLYTGVSTCVRVWNMEKY